MIPNRPNPPPCSILNAHPPFASIFSAGIKYADGVMIAADTLASYGSMARYKDIRRVAKFGTSTLIGASGEMSDFQSISKMLDTMVQDDINEDDG